MNDVNEEIKFHMVKMGMEGMPSFPLKLDGKFYRFKTNSSGNDGWYVGQLLQNNGIDYFFVSYGNWATGNKFTCSSHWEHDIPLHINIEFEKLTKGIDEEINKIRKEAYDEMIKIYSKDSYYEYNKNNRYLEKKKITINLPDIKEYNGELLNHNGDLVIPIFDINEKLVSIQYINVNGNKSFFKGLPLLDGFFNFKGKEDEIIYLTEGFANAATVFQCTLNTVFVAFSAQRLEKIVPIIRKLYISQKIVVIADNDGEKGFGQDYAIKSIQNDDNSEVVIPKLDDLDKCDINDVFVKLGESGVINQLFDKEFIYRRIVNDILSTNNLNSPIENIPDSHPSSTNGFDGIINDIINYYNITAIKYQPGFAIQTALAFCSVILGRKFKTSLEHYPSLFFLNVGPSGCGKEHQIRVIETLLDRCSKDYLIGPSGYTSEGALMSALELAPAHISLIDEFGDYIISLKDKNSSQRLVNKCLLQIYSRCGGNFIGNQYSNRTNKNSDKTIIRHPALTILAGVQQSKFFESINRSMISDGFLGRFLICETKETPYTEFTNKEDKKDIYDKYINNIINWVRYIDKRLYGSDQFFRDPGYSARPNFHELKFDDEALCLYNNYNKHLFDDINPKLRDFEIEEISNRWLYMIGCLSLIFSLSNDPFSKVIKKNHVLKSIEIIDTFCKPFVDSVVNNVDSTEHEKDRNSYLKAFKKAGNDGITSTQLCRDIPFRYKNTANRNKIIEDLINGDLITFKKVTTSTKPTYIYYIK